MRELLIYKGVRVYIRDVSPELTTYFVPGLGTFDDIYDVGGAIDTLIEEEELDQAYRDWLDRDEKRRTPPPQPQLPLPGPDDDSGYFDDYFND